MTNNTEQQAVPVAQEAAIVAVAQEDRDAVQAFHHVMLLRLMSDVKSQRPKLGDDEGDAGTLVQAFARHRLASLPCKSGEGAEKRQCSVCTAIVAAYKGGMCCHCHELPWAGIEPTPDPDATQTREAEGDETVAILSGAVRRILARCEAVEDENSDQLGKGPTEASSGFLRGERSLAKSIRRELHDLTRVALNARGGA